MNGIISMEDSTVKRTDTSPSHPETLVGRRKLLAGAALSTAGLSLPSLLAACGGTAQQNTTTPGTSEGNFPEHPKWNFVFVNHVTTNPFFVPTQYGIQDACALLGCSFQWTGSANADVAEMVNAMNAAIAAKAAAIAVPIVDPHAFDAPVQTALDACLPVFAD